jgi:hypothetical protein
MVLAVGSKVGGKIKVGLETHEIELGKDRPKHQKHKARPRVKHGKASSKSKSPVN